MEDNKLTRVARADAARMFFDFYKHLTTLNTGSLLLLVTFLEKFSKAAQNKYLLVLSFVGFILSLLSALLAMFVIGGFVRQDMDPTDKERNVWAIFAGLGVAFFFFGILMLAGFAVLNVF